MSTDRRDPFEGKRSPIVHTSTMNQVYENWYCPNGRLGFGEAAPGITVQIFYDRKDDRFM